METLLTVREAIALSPSDSHSYVEERCTHLLFVEEELFNECFGWEFYEALKADIASYTPSPFIAGREYNLGEFVEYGGVVYEVIQATGVGGQALANTAYFERRPKFTTPAFEALWTGYLGRIISFRVMQGGLMYRSVKDTAKGVIKAFDPESSRPATNAEVRGVKEELGADIERMIKAMDAFVNRNSELFPLYKKALKDCGEAGRCRSYNPRKNLGFNI